MNEIENPLDKQFLNCQQQVLMTSLLPISSLDEAGLLLILAAGMHELLRVSPVLLCSLIQNDDACLFCCAG